MRTYTYLLSLFACLMLLASKSMAQPYTLRHLGIEDGLSNNYVTDIVQDSQGCIWIATEAGLNRFNGKDFTVYNTHNSDIAGDALTRLLYDPEENKLWVGTKTGISLLDWRHMGCQPLRENSTLQQDRRKSNHPFERKHPRITPFTLVCLR